MTLKENHALKKPSGGKKKKKPSAHSLAQSQSKRYQLFNIYLQARLQQCVNHELPDVQASFRKGKGTKDRIANIHWIIKKQESSRKTSLSALLTMPKPLTVWTAINCGKL